MGHWGYSAKSGSGFRVLGALLHFGLLEERGKGASREVRLSERGKVLALKGRGDPQWEKAVVDAALSPAIYKKLWEQWGTNRQLPSDSNMRWELETRQGFNPSAIEGFISAFRATIAFTNLAKDGTLSEPTGNKPSGSEGSDGEAGDPNRRTARAHVGAVTEDRDSSIPVRIEDYTIPLRGAGTAVLSVPVPLSRRNYEKLKTWLEWARDSLVADVDDGGTGESD